MRDYVLDLYIAIVDNLYLPIQEKASAKNIAIQ